MKVKVGYKNFYLYGAVNPKTGDHFELILPRADTQCMNIFLDEMAKNLGDKKVIFVMDGAGWHKSNDLNIPSNFTIIFLPPYSPELNPVERFWLHIKQNTIKNSIYYTLKALEDRVCDFVNQLNSNEVASICRADYMFS
jgi:transposase